MGSRPKAPEPTAQEEAIVNRQTMFLDDEIEETESRLRAISRRRLGSESLLTGAPVNARQAASRGGSMFSGGGRGGSTSGRGNAPSSGGSGRGGSTAGPSTPSNTQVSIR